MSSKKKRTPQVFDVSEDSRSRTASKRATSDDEDERKEKEARKRRKEKYRNIRYQIEFYFSEANLTKDRYMMELLHGNSVNWMNIEEFLKFKRVQALTTHVKEIRRALSHSEILELSPDKTCVRRRVPIVPKENSDDCIVYVEGFPRTATIDSVKAIFSQWGNVHFISLPKFPNDRPKGFGFVEFENDRMAEATLQAFGQVGCLMEATPPRHELMDPQKNLSVPPPPLSFAIHNKTEEEAEVEKLLPPDNPKCGTTTREKLEEGEIDVDEKENEEESDDGEIVEKRRKKKKREKKKKNDRTRIAVEVGTLGLKVMLKKEWKKLRNHYMDMQRLNYNRMKQALRNAKMEEEETQRFEADMKTKVPRVGVWPKKETMPESVVAEMDKLRSPTTSSALETPHPWKRRREDAEAEEHPFIKKKKKLPQQAPQRMSEASERPKMSFEQRLERDAWQKIPYVPDSVVKIPADVATEQEQSVFKNSVRSIVTPEHVDCRPEASLAYVRCRDKLSALTLTNSPKFPNAVVIVGPEQAMYWQHVWDAFKEKRMKRRGKNKLQKRIDAYMGIPGYSESIAGQFQGVEPQVPQV
ncbi:unnamed protein product [Notodromas monacha]|uniref:Uncharacterized protein n=1 Tax=Notodromas monacha TaxID=399045 RepID=A0A7R9BXC1_9CRUS|nr:unnamed protein product [Notodromas monacha]CAG0921832.1 unnamed protein product [Notodromas monacha]